MTAVAMLAAVVMGLAGAPPDVAEAARAILRNGGYQTELPRPRSPPDASDAHPGIGSATPEGGRSHPIVLPVPPLIVAAALVIGILLALGLAWMLRGLRETMPTIGRGIGGVPPHRPSPKSSRGASADGAEALAREGRFAEAIHALLLRALAELAARSGSPAASAARTSREVLRDAGLGPEARAALSPLVAAVEWAHFGGRTAGSEDYAACAGHYRRFTDACRATA